MEHYRFSATKDKEFSSQLRKRVNAYFKESGLSKNANTEMVMKTIFSMSLYLVPFIIVLTAGITNIWILFGLFILIGVGKTCIGTSVMHDSLHGSYSSNVKTNSFIGLCTMLLGADALNWQIQHNVLHHTYTNVSGVDEDLEADFFLRFAPHQQHIWFHKYQHLYASVLYCFTTLLWVTVKDFAKWKEYTKMGLIPADKAKKQHFVIIVKKLGYYAIFWGLPLLILDQPAWLTLLMIFSMYAVSGLLLSLVFQLAHVMPDTAYIQDPNELAEESRTVHQLRTTANFSMKSKLVFWFFGGLNFQIEHHLFPNICHIHYPALSKIVQKTAEEFGVEYRSYKSFGGAIIEHLQMLKTLGNPNLVRA